MVNEMWQTENIFDILVSDNLVYNEYTYEEESRTRRDNAERISNWDEQEPWKNDHRDAMLLEAYGMG
jgi:hypothetical protein